MRFWLDDLADPCQSRVRRQTLYGRPLSGVPVCSAQRDPTAPIRDTVSLRIGDNIPKAKKAGIAIKTELILYGTPMLTGESLAFYFNGHGPVATEGPTAKSEGDATGESAEHSAKPSVFQKDWWRRGERRVAIQPEWSKWQ